MLFSTLSLTFCIQKIISCSSQRLKDGHRVVCVWQRALFFSSSSSSFSSSCSSFPSSFASSSSPPLPLSTHPYPFPGLGLLIDVGKGVIPLVQPREAVSFKRAAHINVMASSICKFFTPRRFRLSVAICGCLPALTWSERTHFWSW